MYSKPERCDTNIYAVLRARGLPFDWYDLALISRAEDRCVFACSEQFIQAVKHSRHFERLYTGNYREKVNRYAMELDFKGHTVAIDIDYFNPFPNRWWGIFYWPAHLFGELIPNKLTGRKTDPFKVYSYLVNERGIDFTGIMPTIPRYFRKEK